MIEYLSYILKIFNYKGLLVFKHKLAAREVVVMVYIFCNAKRHRAGCSALKRIKWMPIQET